MNEDIIEKIFPGTLEKIKKEICPTCSEPVEEFRDDLSRQEFKISGMCQKCQDAVFGK